MVLVLLVSPIMASAQSTADQTIDYLALGDSLAAGQTPDKQLGKGYTDYIGNQLNKIGMLASFDKRFSIPGYTTSNILNDIQTNVAKPDSNGIMVDIQSAIQNAELITIDAGANDLLQQIGINQTTGEVTVNQQKVADTLKSVGENTAKILTQIKTLNPRADIYLMGYYNPFPHMPIQYQAQLLPLLDLLNKTISDVGTALNVTFVPTADSIARNATGYLPNPQDIHPNQAGYLVLANDFWKAISVGKSTKFTDSIPDMAKEEIKYLVEKGVISGYGNGSFGANDSITREQSAIMLNRAIVYSDELAPKPNYVDVTETTVGFDSIAKMTQQGVFVGSNQHFYPGNTLTRAQMAIILVQAFHLTGTSTHTFNDVSPNHGAATYISILSENQITVGYSDGTFKPNDPITRAEFSIMLAKALDDRFKVK